MGHLIRHHDLPHFIETEPGVLRGCFVDTNLLFAADYDLDDLNEEAVEICETLVKARIPIFSNSIIRSELLELKRRVLLTEALIDFYHQGASKIPQPLFAKLKSVRDRATSNWNSGESFFLGDRAIKDVRILFIDVLGESAWLDFCRIYLGDKLEAEWNNQVTSHGIGYLDQEHPELVVRKPDWSHMVGLIQSFGIGGSDSMIINFFLCTDLKFIVTSDKDVAFCMSKIETEKVCIVPSALQVQSCKLIASSPFPYTE